MDARTTEALEKSIKHWRSNVRASSPGLASLAGEDCALCLTFSFGQENPCAGCPVAAETGCPSCEGSPYEQAHGAYLRWCEDPRDENARKTWRDAAQAELAFLISLRDPPLEVSDVIRVAAPAPATGPHGIVLEPRDRSDADAVARFERIGGIVIKDAS